MSKIHAKVGVALVALTAGFVAASAVAASPASAAPRQDSATALLTPAWEVEVEVDSPIWSTEEALT